MSSSHTLFAVPHSLYSGRARSYLLKQGIAFRELSTGEPSFKSEVLPLSKRPTIPTLVTPNGEVLRDGAAIIEHFEASNGRPSYPLTPRQQMVSALFDVIGAEGLLRPAMHYRWNFPAENLAYLRFHFRYSQPDSPERDSRTDHVMNKMRQAGAAFGVTEANADLIEGLYEAFLAALNTHFESQPYLLGWKPCIGDYGLVAPLYAHLGRDPAPLRIMQKRAIRVYRWVERMNRPDHDMSEYFAAGKGFLADDEVPDSLLAVLRLLAEDLVPETRAAADCINQFLKDNQPVPGTSPDRVLGMCQFEIRDRVITAAAQPYRFYLLQKAQDIYMALNAGDRTSVDEMLEVSGLASMMTIQLNRRLGWAQNLEVWM